MCGRYTISTVPEQLAERFQASLPLEGLRPRYNAAPTQELPVLLNEGERRMQLLRWGLIPSWAKDPKMGNRMINARAETVAQKSSFRAAFQRRRCLVLADGFYEWQKTSGGKVPMRVTLKSGEPFAFAGLWERWIGAQGEPVRTFTIITTTPNVLLAPIHNRMPVVLLPEHESQWLDDAAGGERWLEALRPYPAGQMVAYPVSKRVNSPAHDDPSVIVPVQSLKV